MSIDRYTMISVYFTNLLLFLIILAVRGPQDLEQTFLNPLDNSYSVLGKQSVFKEYLGDRRVYSFLPYWNLDGRDLNVKYITDLSYFGLNVDGDGRIIKNDGSYKKWREDKDLHKILKDLRKSGGNPSVTIICQDDEAIDSVISCESCWEDLASDIYAELKWAEIKDINVDFEQSGYTSKENADKYTKMVGFLNTYLDKATGGSFVVVSTYADSVERSDRDEVRIAIPGDLAEVADAIFIMAYDFHRPTSGNAGPVSPLDGSYTTSQLNLTKTVDAYVKSVSPEKLILGLPFYGYDWIVQDETPMSSRVEGNDRIGYSGVRTYGEITDLLVSKRIKPAFHDVSESYYFNYIDEETGSHRQVWYDKEESLKSKIALADRNNFLGVGVWALGYEGGYGDLWKVFKSRP